MPMPLIRLPGETRIEQIRRTRLYEHYRDDFTLWIIDERRSHAWIAERIGLSKSTVGVIAHALKIYSRPRVNKDPGDDTALVRDNPDTRLLRSQRKQRARELLRELAQQREENPRPLLEVIREYCAPWDRGW